MADRRIVLLGKTGAGKSSLANTIFGEDVFKINHDPNLGTSQWARDTKTVNGRSITLIDTPGFFDTNMSEKELKPEMVRCITNCAPGTHAFLILLNVEKFTKQESDVIGKVCEYFPEEAFKYAAVVFTHGEQLEEGMTIEKFVSHNKCLSDLVKKCGGRCHVVDNKDWNNNQPDEYRSNQFQVAELLNTIDKIVMENKGGCYFPETRIVLLGKTGSGKSSLANTIFGEDDVFKINHTFNSETKRCQAETRSVNRRSITLIDTPGLFDTDTPEEELKTEIVGCITEWAPGPHAFLILLKVEKFTKQENDVIKEICECFSDEAFKYAAVVFTHGEQLPKEMTIEEFVQQNQGLRDLVRKCGGRYHVVDNNYWNNRPNEYRSNQFQVAELLNTIDNIVLKNNGGYYTNEILQTVERKIKEEEKRISQLSVKTSEQEIREQAKVNVSKKLSIRLAGTATGILLGALLGVPVMIIVVVTALTTMQPPAAAAAAAAVEVTVGAAGVAVTTGLVVGGVAAAGAAVGGLIGYREAVQANSAAEAVENTAKSIWDIIRQHLKKLQINKKRRQSEEKESLLTDK